MKKDIQMHPHRNPSIKNGCWCSFLFIAFLLSATQLTAQNMWEGNTNSDWATASNWSLSYVPLDTQDVVIPTTDNDPIISATTAAVAKSVSVQSGATLTIAAMGSLTVDNASYYGLGNEGTVNNNGTINLGTVASVTNQGILNYGTITNNKDGEINIDRASAGVTNYTGTFTNNGILKIGENVGISSPGIYNEANFINASDGKLQIIKASSSGIYNLPGSSFSNDGLIEIGLNGSINGPAIYNFTDFQNNTDAEIKIENTGYGIDHREGATFDNLGAITIGANAPVQYSAIFNEGTFNNSGDGIMIDSSRVGIDNRYTGIFNNEANLYIGANTTIEDIGVFNLNEFTNDGGEITIDRVENGNGIYNDDDAEFDNNSKITIGGVANVAEHGLVNYGIFTNETTAEISINRITSSYVYSNINGIYNGSNATFHNWGNLLIGNEAGSFNHGLFNAATFFNYADAEITIDRITGEGYSKNGLYNDKAFTNYGKVSIGDAVSAGNFGLFNDGTSFLNDGGEININNANSGENTHCFYNDASFTNNGTINIGSIANGSDWGLFNTSTFENTGTLNIDRTALVGFRNHYGTFNNSGTFNIGQTADIGEWGFWNQATFNNLATGIINIDRSTIGELLVKYGSFLNEGWISASTNTSVAQYGFWNDATFDNAACGTFEVFAAFSNNDVFTNAGLLVVNSEDTHLNSGFDNDGVIAYFQDNPIPSVTNNEIITTPVSTDCGAVTPALDLAAMIDLTIGTTWYQDEALTIPAGNYDQGTNTFTFTDAPAGLTNTLYFPVTDDANTCSMTVPIIVTFTDDTPPSISCPNQQTLVLEANCMAMLPDYTGLATTDDNCSVTNVQQLPSPGTTVTGVGETAIELTATDLKGNANSCSFSVVAVDNTPPAAVCQDVTVQLNASGLATITAAMVDNGSSDGCSLAAVEPLTLDITDFTCTELGSHTVELTVTDATGNENACTATVTVEDNIAPEIATCEGNVAVFNGEETIDVASLISLSANDACGYTTSFSPATISCEDLGANVPVLVTVSDASGNSNTCTATVTVDGLPCGFMDFGEDGIGCEDSNNVVYDTESDNFTLTSNGCSTANFSQDDAAYVQAELCGNGEIVAHITSISPTGLGWAGIAMRESEAPGSKKVELLVNLGNIVRRAIRTTTNGYAYPGQLFRPQATWLKIVRTGNLFVGYASTDGVYWQNILVAQIPMTPCIQAGLIVTNYNGSSVVSASFDNVEVIEYSTLNVQIPNTADVIDEDILARDLDFTIFPNPAKDQIQLDLINFVGQEVKVQILNQLGQPILEQSFREINHKPTPFDLQGLSSGTYFVRLTSNFGENVKKLIIVK